MRWRPSSSVTGTSVASTELCLSTSRSTVSRPLRSSLGSMRSRVRNGSDSSGASPNTRRPSGEKIGPPSPRFQSKLPMRARSCARARRDLLRSSSCRVRAERSR
jgi:hypothetical protein